MKIDKTQISGVQFMLLIACFLQASGLLTFFVSMVLVQDAWMASIIAVVGFIPILLVYKKLAVGFPGKNLFQIYEIVFGRKVGKIISFLTLLFFLGVTLLNVSDLTKFTKLGLLARTPELVIVVVCVITAAFAVKFGLKVIAKLTPVFLVSSVTFLILSFVLLISEFDFSNFLPIFNFEFIRYIQGAHIVMTVPLGELIMFLMLVPNVKTKSKKVGKYVFGGLFLGALVPLIVVIRDIATVGNIFHILSLPQLISLRLVNIGDALSRLEILFFVILILMLFFKIALLMYIVSISICQVFEIEDHIKLLPMLCIMIIALTKIFTDYNAELHLIITRDSVPFLVSIFEFIFPIIALIIAKVWKKTLEKTYGKKQPYLKTNGIRNFQKYKLKVFKEGEQV